MTTFIPRSPKALKRKEKGAYSCSLSRDKSSSTRTRVGLDTQFNHFLSAGRALVSLMDKGWRGKWPDLGKPCCVSLSMHCSAMWSTRLSMSSKSSVNKLTRLLSSTSNINVLDSVSKQIDKVILLHLWTTMELIYTLPCPFTYLSPALSLVHFSSRWYLHTWKSLYTLHPISLKFPQYYLWKSSRQ